jgi:hypothetical protein
VRPGFGGGDVEHGDEALALADRSKVTGSPSMVK